MAEETDDFYEFTAEDYYRILAAKKEGNIDDGPILWVVIWKDEAVLLLTISKNLLQIWVGLNVIPIDKIYFIGGHINGIIVVLLEVTNFGRLDYNPYPMVCYEYKQGMGDHFYFLISWESFPHIHSFLLFMFPENGYKSWTIGEVQRTLLGI
jgi:hypothetical protein